MVSCPGAPPSVPCLHNRGNQNRHFLAASRASVADPRTSISCLLVFDHEGIPARSLMLLFCCCSTVRALSGLRRHAYLVDQGWLVLLSRISDTDTCNRRSVLYERFRPLPHKESTGLSVLKICPRLFASDSGLLHTCSAIVQSLAYTLISLRRLETVKRGRTTRLSRFFRRRYSAPVRGKTGFKPEGPPGATTAPATHRPRGQGHTLETSLSNALFRLNAVFLRL